MSVATMMAIALTASGVATSPGGICVDADWRAPSAIRTVDCTAPAPVAGQPFVGPVLQVLDGRTVCVALGPTPDQWIEVDLADGKAAVSRPALMRAVFAQRIVCVADRAGGRRVVAHCGLGGVSVGSLGEPASADSVLAGR